MAVLRAVQFATRSVFISWHVFELIIFPVRLLAMCLTIVAVLDLFHHTHNWSWLTLNLLIILGLVVERLPEQVQRFIYLDAAGLSVGIDQTRRLPDGFHVRCRYACLIHSGSTVHFVGRQ